MKYILIILLTCFAWSQTSTSSLLGLGENIQYYDPSTVGAGGNTLFSSHSDEFTSSSPTTLWKTNTTRLSISTSFNRNRTDGGGRQESQLINQISFTFPIKPMSAISFGLRPHTRSAFQIRTNYDEAEHVQFDENVFAPAFYYHSSGGISRYFISYSKKINDTYSLGITWNNEFGNLFLTDSVLTYKVTTNSESGATVYSLSDISINNLTQNFNGSSIYFEGRYTQNKNHMVLGIELENSLTIKSKNYNPITGSESTTAETIKMEFTGFKGGYEYKHNETISGIVEVNYYKPLKTANPIFGLNNISQLGLHTGIIKRVKNSKLGRWDFLNISTGLYSYQHKTSNGNYSDTGISFGLGMEYFNKRNMIDLVITAGKRTSPFDELTNEEYINLMVGITTGETWFIKRRKK
ncbi:MAG: hypothetical protein HN729_06970 [Candidatus Marinimicrobia bacterium]|jgi:hypothetical protein|nr:hypothetical protein [Candidatus Neomarinimicrobiota bacterium]MBT3633635.1 hypothetical protein [Candidatus Neomarinimicrobiota bacterium]MBT3682412.1 hypothetical protein [Candidatus Neomarinimicrobiota bacterium]MBT3759176.1 hypothetical protein [Candidatus Neomarinimicrobiota bacterium]MBT3895551.1 hypothetical protein [Candidatus Neomarinimicrobiota bacterium]